MAWPLRQEAVSWGEPSSDGMGFSGIARLDQSGFAGV